MKLTEEAVAVIIVGAAGEAVEVDVEEEIGHVEHGRIVRS